MHSFDPEIAKIVGINAAVIYQNLVWWTQKNAANERHYYDGRYWTYNSVKAFDDLFPYLTRAQIRSALIKLEEAGLIVTGNFNQSAYDRTKWYSPNDKLHLSNLANGFAQDDKPIPDSNPDIKPDTFLPETPVSDTGEKFDPKEVVEVWNETAAKLGKPKVRDLTPERRQLLRNRMAQYTVDDFVTVLNNIESSPFLRGDTGWRGCSFDWVFKKANFQKILEGNYNG